MNDKFNQDTMVGNNTRKIGGVIRIDKTGRVMCQLPNAGVSGWGDSIDLKFLDATFDMTCKLTASEARKLAYRLLLQAESNIPEDKPVLKGVRSALARFIMRGIL